MLEASFRRLKMKSLSWLASYWIKSDDSIQNLLVEEQNQAYEGLTFELNDETYRSRLAKKTPNKKGYFVVFWEKNRQNNNQPYAFESAPNQLIVLILDEEKQGVFLFPKKVLLEQGILRDETTKGKMAIRVYPTWENELNVSAQRTQKWQEAYFTDYTNK